MVIFGTLTGAVLSVFDRYCQFGAWWQERFPEQDGLLFGMGIFFQAVYGNIPENYSSQTGPKLMFRSTFPWIPCTVPDWEYCQILYS